jgi:integral membrane protein
MIKILRILGNIEGVSYLLLLFIAMPLKYAYRHAYGSQDHRHGTWRSICCLLFAFGSLHEEIRVDSKIWSLPIYRHSIPFGTFVTDRKIKLLPEANS